MNLEPTKTGNVANRRQPIRHRPAVNALMHLLRSIELIGWCAIARIGVACLPLGSTLRLLDALPAWTIGHGTEVDFPSDRQVRLAGACLGRSLARSQYLRRRAVPHAIVIGIAGDIHEFRAHAWVAPFETAPSEFVELQRIER